MMNILFEPNDEILLYGFDYPTAASFEQLKKACPFEAKEFDGNLISDDKLTIICGSFYMLNSIKGLKEFADPHPKSGS